MSKPHTGRCHCGAVAYELRGAPLCCYTCHCTGCQRSAGSAYTISLLVQRADLTVVSGAVSETTFTLPSGERVWNGCTTCGTPLWYASPLAPEIVAIKQGTLDDPSAFQPVAHLWTQHTQPHVRLPDDVALFEQQPDLPTLLALWPS